MAIHHRGTGIKMEPEVKKQRGGAREGAGRRSQLGPTVRKDLRVPERVEHAAIKLGKGSFSDGVRTMIDEWLLYRERRLPAEKPVLGNPVIAYVAHEERWAVATPEKDKQGRIVFRETWHPNGESIVHSLERWRILPPPIKDEALGEI